MDTAFNTLDELLRACTVRIGSSKEGGTGFFVAPGRILTCAHVVENEYTRRVPVKVCWRGRDLTPDHIEYHARPYPDLAMLHVTLTEHPCVLFDPDVELDDLLSSYGHPDKYREQGSADSVSFRSESITLVENRPFRKLKGGQAAPGLSGASLLNQRTGGVCGIVRLTRDAHSDLGARAVPVETILETFPELKRQHDAFHRQDSRWKVLLDRKFAQPITWTAPPPADHMIGREEQLTELKELLLSEDRVPTVVLMQTPGVGKTELAVHVANDPEVREHFGDLVLWVPVGRRAKVDKILDQLALTLGVSAEEITYLKDNESRLIRINNTIGAQSALLILDDVWNVKRGSDDDGDELQKFQYLLSLGNNCAKVITTRDREVARHLGETGAHIIVPELNDSQSVELLERIAPEVVKAHRQDAHQLAQVVGGLPMAIVLMGRYLRGAVDRGQDSGIKDAIQQLRETKERLGLKGSFPRRPPDAPLTLLASIEMSAEALDPDVCKVLHMISILRPQPHLFSARAAAAVCNMEEEQLRTRLNQLDDAGLVRAIRDEDAGISSSADEQQDTDAAFLEAELGGETVAKEDSVDDRVVASERKSSRYMLPRTIADYARAHLDPATAMELHRRAAEYYDTWLRSNEEERQGDATSYERMYSYEQPEWQDVNAAWLHHLGQTDPAYANLAFARAYFDAFWWWGCYRPFPYCERLLGQWREKRTAPEDQKWAKAVGIFDTAYPTGYDKHGQGDWPTVERALLVVRRLGGLEGDPAGLDAQRRHLRAITDLFLAEARRYQDVQDAQADAYYQEALTLFTDSEDEDDAWNLPWVHWHLADLALERGQGEEAWARAATARRLAVEADEEACARDNEIIANTYRVQADVARLQGDLPRAATQYAHALFFAYAFQAHPKPHDFYTRDFYEEMRERTLAWVQALWAWGEQAAAREVCMRLRGFWAPYWEAAGREDAGEALVQVLEEGRWEDLAASLFPPLPTDEEIEQKEQSPYYCRVRDVFDVTLNIVEIVQ